MPSTERYVTVAEAARYLRVSRSSVYRAITNGRLPAFKVLGSWRVDREELEAWLNQKRPRPGGRGDAYGPRTTRTAGIETSWTPAMRRTQRQIAASIAAREAQADIARAERGGVARGRLRALTRAIVVLSAALGATATAAGNAIGTVVQGRLNAVIRAARPILVAVTTAASTACMAFLRRAKSIFGEFKELGGGAVTGRRAFLAAITAALMGAAVITVLTLPDPVGLQEQPGGSEGSDNRINHAGSGREAPATAPGTSGGAQDLSAQVPSSGKLARSDNAAASGRGATGVPGGGSGGDVSYPSPSDPSPAPEAKPPPPDDSAPPAPPTSPSPSPSPSPAPAPPPTESAPEPSAPSGTETGVQPTDDTAGGVDTGIAPP
jgi:excisionase family DNA binding protein